MESRWRRALRIAALAGAVGFGCGMIIMAVAGAMGGEFLLWLPLFFAAVTFVAGYLLGALVIEGAGDLVGRIYTGGHVGTQREYSHAQALAARGAYREAVEAYGAAAEEFPDDPTPLMLAAEVLARHLGEHEAAARWLRRARGVPGMSAQQDITIARELVELYTSKLDVPKKALPELARVAERYPDTRAAEWARNLTSQIRASVWTGVQPEPEASDGSTAAQQGQR